MRQFPLNLSAGSAQTLPLSQNQSEYFNVAVPISNSSMNLRIQIYDLDGKTILYDQTWYNGLSISAMFVSWSKIVFTEQAFSYTITPWIKKMTADNVADMILAQSAESITVTPLSSPLTATQTLTFTAPTVTSVNSNAPTSGSEFTASITLSVESDLIVIPIVASALLVASTGGTTNLLLDSTTEDTTTDWTGTAQNDIFDAKAISNVSAGSHSLIISTSTTINSSNTGYYTFYVISVPSAGNTTSVFAQVATTGSPGASTTAFISGSAVSVSISDVSAFSVSFSASTVDSLTSAPDFTLNMKDENSNVIGSLMTVNAALPLTLAQAGVVSVPTKIQFSTPTFTALSSGGIVGYISQVILKA